MNESDDYTDHDVPPTRRWVVAITVFLIVGLGFVILCGLLWLFIRITVRN